MKAVLLVFLGGGIGAVSRYALSGWIQKQSGSVFPWGTLAVNLLGCFLIGFLFDLFDRSFIPREYRSLALTGFLGAFTTFSTFGLETLNLMRDREIAWGSVNILVSNLAGIVLVFAGLALSRLIFKTVR